MPPRKARSTRAAAQTTPNAAQTPQPTRRRGLRSTTTSSPLQISEDPDRLLRARRSRAPRNAGQTSEEDRSSAEPVPEPQPIPFSAQDKESDNAPVTPEHIIADLEKKIEEQATDITRYRLIIAKLLGARENLNPSVFRKTKIDAMERIADKPWLLPSLDEGPDDTIEGNQAALDLLHQIENNKEPANTSEPEPAAVEAAVAMEGTVEAQPVPTTPQPEAAPQVEATPRSTGWGITRLFGRFIPGFSSPSVGPAAAPSTQPPAQPSIEASATPTTPTTPTPAPATPEQTQPTITLPQDMQDEIRASLAPVPSTPTPSTPTSHRTARRTTTSRATPRRRSSPRVSTQTPRPSFEDRTIMKQTLRSLDPMEKQAAKEWFEDTLAKIAQLEGEPGAKRKRVDIPTKIKDLESIPARAPWQSEGVFGLQDDFFDDDSDDEAEVPGWYWIQMRLKALEGESEQPAKRRKLRNSHGASTSLDDLSPRSSTDPSPMFSGQRYQGGNIFTEDEASRAPPPRKTMTLEEQIRRHGHVPGSGAFGVPDLDSDDDESMIDESETDNTAEASKVNDTTKTADAVKMNPFSTTAKAPLSAASSSMSTQAPSSAAASKSTQAPLSATPVDTSSTHQPWTQQPPPAPVPAHASLPGLSAPPATPARSADDHAAKLEAQRKTANKHAPKTPSRLRNTSIPSPSPASSIAGDNEQSFAPTAGSHLRGGLLTQPHVAAGTTPSQKTVNPFTAHAAKTTTKAAATTTATSSTTASAQQATTAPNGKLTDEGKYVEYTNASGNLVRLGPYPALTDFGNTPELNAKLDAYMKGPEFAQKTKDALKDAPELLDLSEEDDLDALFPDGDEAMTPAELDAEMGL